MANASYIGANIDNSDLVSLGFPWNSLPRSLGSSWIPTYFTYSHQTSWSRVTVPFPFISPLFNFQLSLQDPYNLPKLKCIIFFLSRPFSSLIIWVSTAGQVLFQITYKTVFQDRHMKHIISFFQDHFLIQSYRYIFKLHTNTYISRPCYESKVTVQSPTSVTAECSVISKLSPDYSSMDLTSSNQRDHNNNHLGLSPNSVTTRWHVIPRTSGVISSELKSAVSSLTWTLTGESLLQYYQW